MVLALLLTVKIIYTNCICGHFVFIFLYLCYCQGSNGNTECQRTPRRVSFASTATIRSEQWQFWLIKLHWHLFSHARMFFFLVSLSSSAIDTLKLVVMSFQLPVSCIFMVHPCQLFTVHLLMLYIYLNYLLSSSSSFFFNTPFNKELCIFLFVRSAMIV